MKIIFASVFISSMVLSGATTAPEAEEATPDSLVHALNGVFGDHKARAVHAKGVVLKGIFTAVAGAEQLSRAPHLQSGSQVPVIVRFSDFAGVPTIADNDGLASPRGIAIKFKLADGTDSDIVAHSFNGFPVATADEFQQLLLALASSKPDTPKPTPLDKFLGAHPIAKAFLTAPKPMPESYATLPYFGVNSFKFTNNRGAASFGRYQIVPGTGEHFFDDGTAKSKPANYLIDEIAKRVKTSPVVFSLVVQNLRQVTKLRIPR